MDDDPLREFGTTAEEIDVRVAVWLAWFVVCVCGVLVACAALSAWMGGRSWPS
jgi:hypothetical protein